MHHLIKCWWQTVLHLTVDFGFVCFILLYYNIYSHSASSILTQTLFHRSNTLNSRSHSIIAIIATSVYSQSSQLTLTVAFKYPEKESDKCKAKHAHTYVNSNRLKKKEKPRAKEGN